MMLYDGTNGIVTPKTIDTGVLLITKDHPEGVLRSMPLAAAGDGRCTPRSHN